jgi:hypothetical protein
VVIYTLAWTLTLAYVQAWTLGRADGYTWFWYALSIIKQSIMEKVFLLSLFLLIAISSEAQPHPQRDTSIHDIGEIGTVIGAFYHPNQDSVENSCWDGCVFIRFNISNKRQFTNVAYTVSTPVFIKTALDNAIKVINQGGFITNGLNKLGDKVYVLPFMVTNNEGCGFPTGWETGNEKVDPQKAELYKRRQENFHQSFKSIWNITNFTDGKTGVIDCILLPVMVIGGTMH